MTFQEFIEMIRAVQQDRPFKVGFQLQHDMHGGMTIQELCDRVNPGVLVAFLTKVQVADSPDYEEETMRHSKEGQR